MKVLIADGAGLNGATTAWLSNRHILESFYISPDWLSQSGFLFLRFDGYSTRDWR